MSSSEEPNPLDKQTTHTKAEAYVVVAQLNYRAGATRHARPNLSKIRELHGDISNERAKFIMAQTDRRIEQAAKREREGEWSAMAEKARWAPQHPYARRSGPAGARLDSAPIRDSGRPGEKGR